MEDVKNQRVNAHEARARVRDAQNAFKRAQTLDALVDIGMLVAVFLMTLFTAFLLIH